MTSHAAQGLTVDKVFVAGAMSREGLYVSATRGREAIRVFVADREAFLDAAELRSEVRMSALEFVRQRALGRDLRSVLARGWCQLLRVRAGFVNRASPRPVREAPEETVSVPMREPVAPSAKITISPAVLLHPRLEIAGRPRAISAPHHAPAPRMRIRF